MEQRFLNFSLLKKKKSPGKLEAVQILRLHPRRFCFFQEFEFLEFEFLTSITAASEEVVLEPPWGVMSGGHTF